MEIQTTSDGSHTLYIPEMDEHYHSVNGAVQESCHVYVEAGLNHCKKQIVNVLEFGFGTGLNTFLTFIEAEKRELEINYTTIEKYLLPNNIINRLNYALRFGEKYQEYFKKIHDCDWEEPIAITNNFRLKKVQADFSVFVFESNYDVIFYDAFAPDKQPEVWTQEIFNRLFMYTNPEGILTTYCAKGNIRRMIQSAGFCVERIPGPPGKREMLRAVKKTKGL